MKKKFLSIAVVAAMAISLAACGGNNNNAPAADSNAGDDTAATETTDAEPSHDSIAVCIASEPDTIDPHLNSSVDGATMVAHLFSGLAKWSEDASGNLVIAPDAAEELVEGELNEDGTMTYTYTLRDGMEWSDGKPVTAQDFEFSWKRSASPALAADYCYMLEAIDGYEEVWDVDDEGNQNNPDAELNVHALDEKTLEVTTTGYIAYWNELLAFPSYYPVREDVVSNEAWATDPSTYVCNGMYKMTGWDHNSVITLEKNEGHVDADEVTMNKIEFYLSDDANNMLSNFENGTWQLIDDVPTNEIANLKVNYPDEFVVAGQIGTYYVCFNVNEDILPSGSGLKGVEAEEARAEIRNAISLLFDRTYIVEEIGQAGQVPASSFVAMGMTEPDGSEFYLNAGPGTTVGYFDPSEDALEDNFAEAIEVLSQYYDYDESTGQFSNFPTMTYLYNTSEGHKAIGEYLQSALAGVGITMNLENQEWNTFLNTRKNGEYTIARNGWLADFNDPITFLDMWTTISGNNDIQYGRDAHKDLAMYDLDLSDLEGYEDFTVEDGTWAETFDELIGFVKTEQDPEIRFEMMHRAEDLLMSTGCIVPLYYYTDIYMIDSTVDGFFANPLGYKYFMYCTW